MAYVLGTVISVLLMAFMSRTEVREDNKMTRILRRLPAMIPLFLLSALRWDVGTDTWHTYTPEYFAMMSESRELTEKERQILIEDYRLYNRSNPEVEITEENAMDFYSETY